MEKHIQKILLFKIRAAKEAFRVQVIRVLVFVVLFIFCCQRLGFSESFPELSGRYKGYNVILIILDALRPDHLSCYGYGKKTSPNIDALAKEGVLFRNAFSQASYTLPSVTSIFTSVYPYSHGTIHILKDKVSHKLYTLAQVLGLYGYKTIWLGPLGDPHTGSADGLLRGFSETYEIDNLEENKKLFSSIQRHEKEQFFLTIHSYAVHESRFPFQRFDNEFSRVIPKDFLDAVANVEKERWDKIQNMFRHNELASGIFSEDWIKKNKLYLDVPYSKDAFDALFCLAQNQQQQAFFNKITVDTVGYFLKSLSNKKIPYLLSLFDSAIYERDANLVQELIGKLKELNLYKKTIIIITADHGNEFKERGYVGHGRKVYDEVMRVPLIFHLPNWGKKTIVTELAQSIDIFPTVLDLLAIPVPSQSQGITLAGLIEGKKNAVTNDYVFCQGIAFGITAIRSKDWKYIRKFQESMVEAEKFNESLFNLKKDPHELHNVIKDNPKVTSQLRNRLDSWMKSLPIYREGESEFMPWVDEETKDRIKKTGYW